ncbi:Unknown protein [Striga hermonthica]|uniref:Micronuclear linker histone polyprotein-like protein n=1 Tax=Striga hermonthica TaxID=68872 RepID=A0A9N7R5P1_STRHE|nr:Unknown protein [Striga hermonthica]
MRTTNNGHSHGGYYRRRWANVYVPMSIIALVCGCGLLLGVVGLQRLKERRLLDRLIKEKDGQILSLHLLLQKEKDHSQEIKRKTEEMRTKMYNLRARNTNLNARISSMQSAISSLKDEQRAIELHLHETQNEAKSALIETSRRKESEIEELKNHLRSCAESKNEPSITTLANQTAIAHDEEGNNNYNNKRNNNGNVEDSSLREVPMQSVEESENGEQMDKEKNEHKRPTNTADVKELSTANQETGASDNGVKMEIQENVEGFQFRGRQSFLRRSMGTKWKKINEEGKLGNYYQGENRDALIMTGSSNTKTAEESPPSIMKIENSTKPVEVSGTNEDPDDVSVENFPEGDLVGKNTNTKSIGSREEEAEKEDRMDESDNI